MKKFFLLISMAFGTMAMNAETVNISAENHLAELISDGKTTITELVVVTDDNTLLSAADMTFIAEMSALESLDLRGVGYERGNNCPGFSNNATIKEIWWPNNVTFIGSTTNNAFEKMHLPPVYNNTAALTRLFNNPKLEAIDFYGEVPAPMEVIDGVIYGWGNTLCYYPSGKKPENGNVVIREGITGIMSIGSLGYNQYISTITLPATFNVPSNMRFLTEKNTNLKYIYVTEGNPYMMTLFNDGCLYDKTQKSILWTSPVLRFDEDLLIDGSLIESIPQGFLNGHNEVKRIKFTEGYKALEYAALKNAQVESVELPASLERIASEAMHTMPNLQTIICHADADPLGDENPFFQVALHERSGEYYIGWNNFYGQHSNVQVGVPAGHRDLYINSGWCGTWTHPEYTNNSRGYKEEQFVEYQTMSLLDADSFHDAAVPGMVVKVTAKSPSLRLKVASKSGADVDEDGYEFVKWRDIDADRGLCEPVEFADPEAKTTTFTMPARPINIQAVYRAPDGTLTSLDTVEASDNVHTVQYFNLQGMPVANPTQGLYIVRRGNSVTKVLVK